MKKNQDKNGIFFWFVDEGEYICPRCTIFGLEKSEVETLIGLGFKMTDHNKDDEGYEVQSSVFKVSNFETFSFPKWPFISFLQLMRKLGSSLGFQIHGEPVCTDAPGERKTLVYTMTKEI